MGRKRLKIAGIGVLVLGLVGGGLYLTQTTHHSSPRRPPAPIAVSGDPLLDSIRRGIEYLKVHQEEDNEFSRGLLDPKPAFTALVVDAVVKSPDAYRYDNSEFIRKACDAIVSHQQDDGGIYTPAFGLGNYCTSISIMALKTADAKRFAKVIERGVAYIRKSQLPDEASRQGGGFGYGSKGGNADLSNTLQSLEALRQAGLPEDDPAIVQARKFITRCQNNSETNPEKWATNDGGFIYRPGKSKAGELTKKDGTTGYKSYGLMSYAGLMSLLHAYVAKQDQRVQAALQWVRENYTFDENVNLGAAGLYYYYLVMSKALAAYGERYVVTPDGKRHDWARDLSAKIVQLQRKDGSWKNSESAQWLESDTVLVTAYMVRALTHCHEAIQTSEPKSK